MASASSLRNLYQGVEKGSFGYKMLETLGWKEGQGLGANKQGIKEHVKVKKKQDALGVGAAEHVHKLRDWTTGMVGFDAILTGLKEISRSAHSSGGSSSAPDSSSSEGRDSGYDSDSDTSGRVVAAQKASKKATRKHDRKTREASKKRRNADIDGVGSKDSKAKKHKSDAAEVAGDKKGKKTATPAAAAAAASDSSDSDGDSEPAGNAAATVPAQVSRVKAATHLGRYQKREKAKTVRNYSASDLAAILGLPGSAPGVPNAEGAAGWAAVAGISNPNGAGAARSSSSDDSDDEKHNSEQRLRPGTPPGSDTPQTRPQEQQQHRSDDETTTTTAAGVEDAAADGKVWWRSVFVRGGRGAGSVGSSGRARINISGFQEQDQTNLYIQAHETAVKNKQGLGRSAMPKKVAGARWQGTKTKLGSDDEDDEQQQQHQQQHTQEEQQQEGIVAVAIERESYTKNGITIVMPMRRSEEQQRQQQKEHVSKGTKRKQQDSIIGGKKGQVSLGQQTVPQKAAAVDSSRKSKKAKQQPEQHPMVAETAAAAADAKKVKWAKLAARILEGAPKKRMRVQKLHKKVVAAAGFDVDAPGVDSEALYQQMLTKLRRTAGLEVCEKYVTMA